MVMVKFSIIIVVLFLLHKSGSETPGSCSIIKSQHFRLSIYDLEDKQIKKTLILNITDIENKNVGEFLDYLVNVEKVSISSHVVSVKSLNPPTGVSPYSTISPLTALCEAIDVSSEVPTASPQYTLFVGAELTARQKLVKRFLKGLQRDNHMDFFKSGNLSPIIFDKTYEPVETPPTPSIVLEKRTIHTTRSTDSTSSSKSDVSADISAYIVTVSAKYSTEEKSTSKRSNSTKIAVVSLLNRKTDLYVDERRMDLDPSIVQELYDIVNNFDVDEFTRTINVVKLLNKYGWYVPNSFVLGGRLDVVKSEIESSGSDEKTELQKLETKLSAAYGAYKADVGASSEHGSGSVNKTSFFSSDERVTSTVDGAMDIETFMKNVEIENNWRIIELNNIIPTCKFLLRNDSGLFATIRRLVIYHSHYPKIRELQRNIDMIQYVNDLWSEYDQPF
ncbi:uncharacterized protein [Drosophila tropicalis]|uniref:uncharacterized protein n=1 Tax=Drosophila tropicalis TaxID=46794 RepID=UPI0035ABC4EE